MFLQRYQKGLSNFEVLNAVFLFCDSMQYKQPCTSFQGHVKTPSTWQHVLIMLITWLVCDNYYVHNEAMARSRWLYGFGLVCPNYDFFPSKLGTVPENPGRMVTLIRAVLLVGRLYGSAANADGYLTVFHPAYVDACLQAGDMRKVCIMDYYLPPAEMLHGKCSRPRTRFTALTVLPISFFSRMYMCPCVQTLTMSVKSAVGSLRQQEIFGSRFATVGHPSSWRRRRLSRRRQGRSLHARITLQYSNLLRFFVYNYTATSSSVQLCYKIIRSIFSLLTFI